MTGKILKVFKNDINGKEDEREVILLASFIHKKYMNKYAIFTFKTDNLPKKLYYGSIFLKENSLVIFNIKEELKPVIMNFIEEYKSNNFSEYELIDITNYEKVELVNYNEIDYPDISLLYSISFPIKDKEEVTHKKNHSLIIIIIIFFLLAIVFITYYYLNQNKSNNKELTCTKNTHNYDINLDYNIIKNISFDKDDIVKSIEVTETYKFPSNEEYNTFKNENKHYEYFTIDGTYKYLDEEQELKIFYHDKTVARDYEQIKSILNREGYICKEDTNE